MPIRYTNLALVCATLFVCLNVDSNVSADESFVRFDVPALVGVHALEFADGHEPDSSSQKIIEVVIPVTTEIGIANRENIDEFRFDVYWNRNVYPMVDYGPKTQTVSRIEGLIAVEKTESNNSGIGLNLSSAIPDVVSGTAKADLSKRSGTTTRYEEIPQHEVLVASGSIQRGTGAFFRFHPSKRQTLEGGRDLIVAFRVPQSWRAGAIKVECRAHGHRKIVGTWRESVEESRAFVVPIFLEGDDQARQAAEDFVRSEQGLRRNWQKHQKRSTSSASNFFSFAPRPTTPQSLPNEWVHQLIQSGSDLSLDRYRSRMSEGMANAAEDFVVARKQLFAFSR